MPTANKNPQSRKWSQSDEKLAQKLQFHLRMLKHYLDDGGMIDPKMLKKLGRQLKLLNAALKAGNEEAALARSQDVGEDLDSPEK